MRPGAYMRGAPLPYDGAAKAAPSSVKGISYEQGETLPLYIPSFGYA